MKQALVLLALIVVFLLLLLVSTARPAEKPKAQKADSTFVMQKTEVTRNLQKNYEEAEQRFNASLTKEQRQLQDLMKSIIVEANVYGSIRAVTDTTITFKQ